MERKICLDGFFLAAKAYNKKKYFFFLRIAKHCKSQQRTRLTGETFF